MRFLLLIVCWLLSLAVIPVFGQEDKEAIKGDSFLFSFVSGEAGLDATYGNNTIEMERLNRKVWPAMNSLLGGGYHLLIVSHIYSETGSVSLASINTATWRASSVRKYLKNKYELDNNQIAFYVDRSGNWGNTVHVYLLYYPMPGFANRQMCYSEVQSPVAVRDSFERYATPPYIYVVNDPDLCEVDQPFAFVVVDNKAELPYEQGMMEAVRPPSVVKKQIEDSSVSRPKVNEFSVAELQKENVLGEEKQEKEVISESQHHLEDKIYSSSQEMTHAPQAERTEYTRGFYPVFQPFNLTVRTNLLPWATLSPGLSIGTHGASFNTGSIMPNIEVEYMFGGWGSVVLGGTYSRFGYKSNPNNLWGVSSLMIEPRFWFNDDATYRGFNVGLQMKYGNFNVRDNEPLGHGETGQFFAIGAMLNYLQPIVSGLAFEAGVGFGTRLTFDASTYMRDYDSQVSDTVENFSMTHFMLNFRLALVYRFGFK